MTRGRDWEEREHPRWPDGAPGGKGGEFRDKGAPGGDWASRVSATMVAPRATALKSAKPARRAPASKLKPGQVRQQGLPDGYEMFEGSPDYLGRPTWDVRTVDGEHAFSVVGAEETRDKLQGRIAVSRRTVTGFKAVISKAQNEQFDVRDHRSYSSSRPFYTESRGSLASSRKQAVEDGVKMHRQLNINRGQRQMNDGGIESVSDHDLDMMADHGHWPINQEARKERERRAAAPKDDGGVPAGHVRMYHGRLNPKLGDKYPKSPKALATMVEQQYGLPEGAVYDHPQFAFQRSHRDADPHYYVAPRRDAMNYARGGGEALGDALRAAFYETHGIPASKTRSIEPSPLHEQREAWVNAHATDFGTIELHQVDIPYEVLKANIADFDPDAEWPDAGDTKAWEDKASMMSWPAGIGLTSEERGRTRIKSVPIEPDEMKMPPVEIPLRGGGTLVVEREVKDEVPAHIREATSRFQRGELSASGLAAILEGREDTPLPKLTPNAAKFLTTYVTNSRLNAGERVPIQLTREGLVRVRTGKNGLGMKERWLELTPEGRRVKLALETAPPPVKKAPAPKKLRKSLLPGDQVEWTDEQDGVTLTGVVRREGRFTMVDWEGGRSEKVSARGTDPSIRKLSDAPKDYVQPETVKPVKAAKATVRPKIRPVADWTGEELDAMLLKKKPGTATYEKLLREHERRAGIESPRDYTDDYIRTLPTMEQRAAARAAKQEDQLDRPRAYNVRSNARHFIGKRIKFTSRSFGGRPGTEYEGKLIDVGAATPVGGGTFTTMRLEGIPGSIWVDDRAEVRVIDGSGPPVVVKPPKPEKAADAWLAQVDSQLAGKAPAAESAAHRPVVGRDLVKSLDRSAISELMEISPNPNSQSYNGDPDFALAALVARQGYDGPPEVVSSGEMDRRIAAGWAQTWRGVSSWLKDDGERVPGGVMAEQYRSGDYWPGMGIFGSGTYTAVEHDTVLGYLDGPLGDGMPGLLRIAINPNARVVDFDELVARYENERWERHPEGYQDTPYERLWADMGRYATGLGYDAIAAQPRNAEYRDGRIMYYVILNRTAVAVQEASSG